MQGPSASVPSVSGLDLARGAGPRLASGERRGVFDGVHLASLLKLGS
jgi:hypothetical protein